MRNANKCFPYHIDVKSELSNAKIKFLTDSFKSSQTPLKSALNILSYYSPPFPRILKVLNIPFYVNDLSF